MARKLNPGQNINGYIIEELLNTGAMALSYSAKGRDGRKVFFKQYKSPSIRVPWYKEYVKYQDMLKSRIEAKEIRHMTVGFTETFEAKAGPMTYFQVFEFVTGGKDLSQILTKIKSSPSSISWDQKEIFAKVIMASINMLHSANIVHCDLKPENLQLFKDSEIRAGYRLKLIDMDFSILADKQAPWHGSDQGYVGTPGYFSPEHLQGPKPQPASDVFTCGLILYELLSKQGHPYPYDPEQYKEAVLAHEAHKPELLGNFSGSADSGEVASIIHKCLTPNPAERPSAEDVLKVFNGISRSEMGAKPTPPTPTTESAEHRTSPKHTEHGSEPSAKGLQLVPTSGDSININITTDIGKYLCRSFGEDAKYLDTKQFTIKTAERGLWSLIPAADTTNETMLNNRAVTTETPLKNGDIIGVGKESKGIVKLPLKVQIR